MFRSRVRSALFLVLPALLLSACASESHADLSIEANTLVQPGMPLAEASTALEGAGYQCGQSQLAGDDPAALLCSREQSHRVLATCVQTILITPTTDGAQVADLDVRSPQCTGL